MKSGELEDWGRVLERKKRLEVGNWLEVKKKYLKKKLKEFGVRSKIEKEEKIKERKKKRRKLKRKKK